MEVCPVCLEENNTNMCCNEICFTCRKIFCKKCLNPENQDSLINCPHCKTPFTLGINKDIERCLKIINRDDFPHKSYIHYYLYQLYGEKEDIESSDYHLNQSLQGNCNCAYTAIANKYLINGNLEEYEKNIKIACDKGCLNALISQSKIEMKKGNNEKAKELLLIASKDNQINAQYLLGTGIYEKDFEGDESEAIKWLIKASDRNHSDACFYLAYIYYKNREDEDEDEDKYQLAVKYISKAAELGHPEAQYNFGLVLQEKNDYCKAITWYYKSYNNGNQDAIIKVAECYFSLVPILGDFIYYEGLKILEMEVEKENAPVIHKLGYLYYIGNQYIKRDDQKAFQLISKSAELNYSKSYLTLSEMYKEGFGVEKDYKKACNYAAKYLFSEIEKF